MKLKHGPFNVSAVSSNLPLKVGVVAIAVFATMLVLGYALFGWLVMVLLGALHHSVWESVPALGYGPSVLVAVALGLVSSVFSR
jgi:hypothetical protein